VFGGLALALDPEAKAAIMPQMFAHHLGDPADRVAREEQATHDRLAGRKTTFSAQLIQNNIRVSITALALGMSWGVGTIIVLFYNGVILGLVSVDYVGAGHTTFLLGWLMPHGVIEIPAILIAGQAGLVLAGALIGGVSLMLVWAGLVEAFFSQYHQPAVPYAAKIAFGAVELVLLVLFLARGGRTLSDQAGKGEAG
jgi:uncharacterized membrane protein SpoIIM required for sporulation